MIFRAAYTLGKFGLKSKRGKKLLSEAQKLINKKKSKLRVQESLKKTGPRIQAKTDIRYKFKQKPKHPGGGAAPISARTTHYGPQGKELKVGSHAKRAIWHDTRAKGSESWRSEMTRYFGGLQTGPRSIKRLHKSYVKDIRKLRKKLKTKLSVGGLVIGKNVDPSLL